MTRTDLLPYRLWQVAVPCVAAFVGLLAGLSPVLGLAAALGLVYVALVIQNLALGLAVFVGLTFMESISGVGELSAAKLAGGLLVLGWFAAVVTDDGSTRRLSRDHPVFTTVLVALAAWAVLSIAWSELPAVAFGGAQRWVLDLAMFPIVYTAIREPRHVRWVFALFVTGAIVSAAIGLSAGTIASDAGRLEGSGVNANELGLLMGVAAILAAALGADRELPVPARALAYLGAGLSLVGLLTTGSRGALVGLLFALVIAPFVVGPGRRMIVVVMTVLAVAGAASYLAAFAPAADLERITQSDSTGTGRTEIWQLGWRIVQDKPVLGVGADNYGNSTIHYLLQPGGLTRSEFFVDENKVAHNVYLQVISELGAVGLLLFLFVIGFALRTLLRGARAFERMGDRSMDLLSRALFIALCGHLAAWTFSSDIYSKQMWLLLATAVAIGGIARSRARRAVT